MSRTWVASYNRAVVRDGNVQLNRVSVFDLDYLMANVCPFPFALEFVKGAFLC